MDRDPAAPSLQPQTPNPHERLAALLAAGTAELHVPADATLILAVSGGADSMAMLHGAAHLAATRERGWRLVVAHLDHGLREASDADARFVAEAARTLGLDVRTGRIDVGAEARRGGEGVEAAGRRARYAFLEGVADELGPDALIATAHTADDQAETILLNLARGTGLAGLRGIAPRRGRVVRPLLRARRADLRAALDEAGVAYLDDPSNRDPAFARNRARGALVPLLESLHPGAVAAAARLAELAADEEAFLAGLAAAELAERRAADGSITWDPPPHPVLAQRVLRLAAGPPAPSAERIDAVARAAAEGRGGRRIELGQGRVAEVRARRVVIHRDHAAR